MPLTDLQEDVLELLARSRGHLAGGSALNLAPTSSRFSKDIDFFHGSAEAVQESFSRDREVLQDAGYRVEILRRYEGFVRSRVEVGEDATLIDWSHDSAWRFMPLVRLKQGGLVLHPVDLAINKVLTLVGRGEARDYLDTLHSHEQILPLGAMVWAAPSKDPGFNPASLLEHLKRQGRYRPEDFDEIALTEPLDLIKLKTAWLAALASAEEFVGERPYDEAGCLYYSPSLDRFVAPSSSRSLKEQGLITHFGRLGGVLPKATTEASSG